MTKATRIIALALTCAAFSAAQVSHEDRFSSTAYTYKGVLGTSPTNIVTNTVFVNAIVLVNNSSSDVSVSATDRSTDCGGSACPILPSTAPLVVKAGAVYAIPLYLIEATGGITFTASAANAITARVVGTK